MLKILKDFEDASVHSLLERSDGQSVGSGVKLIFQRVELIPNDRDCLDELADTLACSLVKLVVFLLYFSNREQS